MTSIISRGLNFNIWIITLFRLYPSNNPSRWFKPQIYTLYIILVIPIPLMCILFIFLEEMDVIQLTQNAAFIAQTFCAVPKFYPFVKNGQKIKKCLDYFDKICYKELNEKQESILADFIKICRRNSKIFITGATGAYTCWAISPMFRNKGLPADVWLPFEIDSPFVFGLFYVYLVIGTGYISVADGAIDTLIAGLICLAAGQLKILKDNLQYLDEYTEVEIAKKQIEISKSKKSEIIYRKIKECAKNYDEILVFTKQLEECFSIVTFSQLVGSIFVICFICWQLSKIETLLSFSFLQFAVFMICAPTEIYFFCYYGTILFEESNTLRDAIYMGQWYDYDIKCQKALLLIMERSKMALTITSGKLLNLSVETFTTILRRSYSLLAVLKS